MNTPLCQAPEPELPQLLIGIARLGYRGPIPEHALSSLISHAKEHGIDAVLGWVEEDPGFLFMPTWQFWPVLLTSFRETVLTRIALARDE